MITVAQAATQLGVTPRRVRALLGQHRIVGAVKMGRDWLIPDRVQVTPGSRVRSGNAKART